MSDTHLYEEIAHLHETVTTLEGRMEKLEADNERLVAALVGTRDIVCEAASVGFNYKDGDWAERLFVNNGAITAALRS